MFHRSFAYFAPYGVGVAIPPFPITPHPRICQIAKINYTLPFVIRELTKTPSEKATQIQSYGKPIEDNSQLADEWKVKSLYFLVLPCAISFMEALLPTTTFATR